MRKVSPGKRKLAEAISGYGQWIPGVNALLQTIAPALTEDIRQMIAQADYGQDCTAHRAALDAIELRASVPMQISWVPGEVLELIRWSQPQDQTWKPGLEGDDGHIARLFCCAALLVGSLSSHNYSGSYSDTAFNLHESTIALSFSDCACGDHGIAAFGAGVILA